MVMASGRVPWLVLAALLSIWAATTAHGQAPEDEARSLFERGVAASDAQRWAEAAELFQRSREQVERPNTLFNLVGVLYRLGRYRDGLEAGAAYLRLSQPDTDRARRAEVESFLSEMQLAVGVLSLTVQPHGAAVRVDGRLLRRDEASVALDPGRHELDVTAPRHEPFHESLDVPRGARLARTVVLVPESQGALPPVRAVAADEGEPAVSAPPPDAPPPTRRQRRVRRALWVTGSLLLAGGISALVVASQPEPDRPEPTGGTTGVTLP